MDLLTGYAGVARPAVEGTGDLLDRAVRAALAGDRDAYRTTLVTAAAQAGLALAPVTAELARDLSTSAAVRQAALAAVAPLLPALDPAVAHTVLARACRDVPPPPRTGAQAHPADPAILGPVLVAGLLRATGRRLEAVRG